MLTSDPTIAPKIMNAYQFCMDMAQNHYENFPVASRFLKKELRYPVSAVYAFARSADDFADEGDLSAQQRLALLNNFDTELINIKNSLHNNITINDFETDKPVFIALMDVIRRFDVPLVLFQNLLYAFKQDVVKTRYHNFEEILAYCQNSANPVGRILLYLNNSAKAANLQASDAICTGLQLINFYQDIAQDMDENDRLYLPVDEMEEMNVSVEDLRQRINNSHTRSLLELQIQRARSIYTRGQPLCKNLSGRFALEIAMIYNSGLQILNKLEQNTANIYLRPRLKPFDKLKIISKGIICPYI